MKAWLLDRLEGLKSLRLAEIDDPKPAAGEVVLRVKYAGLNPADRYLTEGQYPTKATFPHILGRDGIGVVESIGEGVSGWKVGDAGLILRSDIGVNRAGTFAEKVAVPVESLAKPPAQWDEKECAGAPLVYLTALQALTQFGELKKSVVLVTGASGGVGVASIQLGFAMGNEIVALSRDAGKREELKKLGAQFTLDPSDSNWTKTLREQLKPRKVDLAIDNIGGTLFSQIIDTLGYRGKVSCVGRLAGPVPEFNTATLFFRRIQIGGVMVGDYKPAEAQAAWKEIVEMLDAGRMRPMVDSVHAAKDLIPAFKELEKGPMGKVLIAW